MKILAATAVDLAKYGYVALIVPTVQVLCCGERTD